MRPTLLHVPTDPAAMLAARGAELRTRIAQHDAQVAALRSQLGSEVTDDEHDPEGTTLSAGWSMLEGTRRAEQAELAEVDAALTRIEDGSYGICERCGRPIPVERLEVRPTARLCVPCASTAHPRHP